MTSTAIRRSAAARLSSRRGAVFVEEAGWELPASYGDDAAERAVIRDRVALADVTARAKVDVRGRVQGTLPLPEDALPARISPSWTVVFGPPDAEASMIDAIGAETGPDVSVTDVTHGYAGFALLGPDVPRVLERATAWILHAGAGGAAAAPVVEVPALIVRRSCRFPSSRSSSTSDTPGTRGGAVAGGRRARRATGRMAVAARAEGWR